jgi:hypothetical protein
MPLAQRGLLLFAAALTFVAAGVKVERSGRVRLHLEFDEDGRTSVLLVVVLLATRRFISYGTREAPIDRSIDRIDRIDSIDRGI